jgi:8-oxo-dGTP pyrophosphatase MutT (NUDIX family)
VVLHRNAVRAILLTPEREVLLIRIRLPGVAPFWVAPGGGIEPDETPADALRRELSEEVGIEIGEIGPLLWKRQHTFNFESRRYCQSEDYFVLHVERFQPRMTDATELTVLDGFRWWTLDELSATSERITPLSLPGIVDAYLREGAPRGPLEVEVVVD